VLAAKTALGGLLIAGALYLYYVAMKLVAMWAVRALNLLAPPITALAEHFWLGSPISGGQWLGLLAVTVGAALVIPSLTRQAGGDRGSAEDEASADG
jgi:drug/metabolite transporter (DMT)-like permease